MVHLQELLCDLNDIPMTETRKDLRFKNKDYLILPPAHIVKTGKKYVLMQRDDTLQEVLLRKGYSSQFQQVLAANPWAQQYIYERLQQPYAFVLLPA